MNFWRTREVLLISEQINEMMFFKQKLENIRRNKLDSKMYGTNFYTGRLEMLRMNVRYYEKRADISDGYTLQNSNLKTNNNHRTITATVKSKELDVFNQKIHIQKQKIISQYKQNQMYLHENIQICLYKKNQICLYEKVQMCLYEKPQICLYGKRQKHLSEKNVICLYKKNQISLYGKTQICPSRKNQICLYEKKEKKATHLIKNENWDLYLCDPVDVNSKDNKVKICSALEATNWIIPKKGDKKPFRSPNTFGALNTSGNNLIVDNDNNSESVSLVEMDGYEGQFHLKKGDKCLQPNRETGNYDLAECRGIWDHFYTAVPVPEKEQEKKESVANKKKPENRPRRRYDDSSSDCNSGDTSSTDIDHNRLSDDRLHDVSFIKKSPSVGISGSIKKSKSQSSTNHPRKKKRCKTTKPLPTPENFPARIIRTTKIVRSSNPMHDQSANEEFVPLLIPGNAGVIRTTRFVRYSTPEIGQNMYENDGPENIQESIPPNIKALDQLQNSYNLSSFSSRRISNSKSRSTAQQ
ncbi:uncharacterized protein VNE69_01036 [Vairimorpha necatrix]|uniref:Uncharacterized protein n=1 Tax=Vairimorpha necatrix TaxID=6039 RepID=A0AAX4J859_9MICR